MEQNWNEFIAQLLARADIVSLVSRYVRLTKKGNKYWGCCPFHNEKTPSFTVSPDRGMFYCFGCQTGGNAITFLSKVESISNYEAIKMLAAELRMELPAHESRRAGSEAESAEKRKRLYALMKEAARHYRANLALDAAKPAADYLKKRGVTPELATKFGLGYSLGSTEVIDCLLAKGYTKAEMQEAGLINQKADRWYDVFFKRLMIPIIDVRGEVIAFGARLLEESDFAKYRNSAQTPIFNKSRAVFAINLVKKKKQREGGIKYIIMTEGYMDVIALHKAGFDTAVAGMGTALTLDQAKLIKGFTDKVYISYDGDGAGQKATLRGLEIMEETGLNVRVITIPDGMDPDDCINKKGREFYEQLMREALPLTAYKLENLKKNYDLTAPDGKSAYAIEAVNVIKKLVNPIEREEYLKRLRRDTGYSLQVLYKQADLPEPESVPEVKVEATKTEEKESDAIRLAKEFVLSELIAAKPYALLSEDFYSLLDDEDSQKLFMLASCAITRENYSPGMLYSIADEEETRLLDKLAAYKSLEGDNAVKYNNCIKLLKVRQKEKQIDKLKKQYGATGDGTLLQAIKDLQAEIHELKRR